MSTILEAARLAGAVKCVRRTWRAALRFAGFGWSTHSPLNRNHTDPSVRRLTRSVRGASSIPPSNLSLMYLTVPAARAVLSARPRPERMDEIA